MKTTAIEKYGDLVGDGVLTIELTQHEKCAILLAYDYGFIRDPKDKAALDSAISKLKSGIWP